MAETSRWDQRTKVSEVLADELPAMQEAINAAAEPSSFDEKICRLLDESEAGELVDWVTVSVHRLPDGSTTTSIHGAVDRSDLQIKGLLHDALWTVAHQI